MTDGIPFTVPPTDPAGLAERLQRLWDDNRLPDVADFLAQAGPLSVDQLAQVLRVDQRNRWRAGDRVPAEEYLRRFPALQGEIEAAVDLVFNEFLLREEYGESPDAEEFAIRFPELAEALRAQIGLHGAMETSTTPDLTALPAMCAAAVMWPMLPRRFGRYRVDRLLGRGGMGEVYLAHDAQLNRRVALKLPRLGDDPERRARFFREARIAGGFAHPVLCPVYDVGEIEGVPFLTMPFLEGETLQDRLQRGPLPVPEAIQLAARLARAMETAHAAGVVHRDLKPSNVMLSPRGEPVVLDFGLARGAAEERLTEPGAPMGTPGYMAPEQLGGRLEDLGPACDIYGLGALLYTALTGEPPFAGPMHEALRRCLTEAPAPPSQRRPGLAAYLDAICLKALSREPSSRFASMAAFAETLEGCTQSATLPAGDQAHAPQLSPALARPATAPPRRRLSRWVMVVAAMFLGLGALAGIIGQAYLARSDPFPAGSEWLGKFHFKPPILNYNGDVAITVESRTGPSFTGIYTTENGAYSWRIKGTIRDGEARWEFTEVVKEKEHTDVVGKAWGEGRIATDELVGLFTHPQAAALICACTA